MKNNLGIAGVILLLPLIAMAGDNNNDNSDVDNSSNTNVNVDNREDNDGGAATYLSIGIGEACSRAVQGGGAGFGGSVVQMAEICRLQMQYEVAKDANLAVAERQIALEIVNLDRNEDPSFAEKVTEHEVWKTTRAVVLFPFKLVGEILGAILP